MLVIDLYSGLGGWSAAFRDRGHDVFTVDIEPKFEPDLVRDMFDVRPEDLPSSPDVVLASPPCNRFSVLTISQSWDKLRADVHPRNEPTIMAIGLVAKALYLIRAIDPPYWVLENPLGMLRKALGPPAATTYFCAWNPGGPKKPTDLWGRLPRMEWPKPKEWIKVPDNTNFGYWAPDSDPERAKIPYGLSEALCIAIEDELNNGHKNGGK